MVIGDDVIINDDYLRKAALLTKTDASILEPKSPRHYAMLAITALALVVPKNSSKKTASLDLVYFEDTFYRKVADSEFLISLSRDDEDSSSSSTKAKGPTPGQAASVPIKPTHCLVLVVPLSKMAQANNSALAQL